ncbi:MAG: COX15/CtaA family protein [Gammaproteobacteria bacterium]|nr:COX15/CtaA family protein [Gammaproteobacteria bacterium]
MANFFSNPHHDNRQLAYWLLGVAVLIYAMVVLGGVTRLTGSGLSIVEWDPIMGAIPPLNETQWQTTFTKYQQSPQYQQVNRGMSLEEFKYIFGYEYAHRLLGRLIGVAFLLPLLYFLYKRKIRGQLLPKLIVIFLLGALQGFLGWYMVQSGLINEPRVSQYRLALHLSTAVMLYAAILWLAWGLLRPEPVQTWKYSMQSLQRWALGVTLLICVMMLSGAFVAGTHAGKVFNTFPLMNGQFIPAGILAYSPWYHNLFENLATVQFDHRLIAYLLMVFIPGLWLYARRYTLSPVTRFSLHLLLVVFAVQIGLGISTLLEMAPVGLATAHQAGALLTFTLALHLNHTLRRGRSF